MIYSVRAATHADAVAIRALIHETHINPTGLNWRRFMVAVDSQNHLVGCGQIKPHRDGSYELASIAVTPSWQNRGVASSIIERLLANHHSQLYLTCRAELGSFYKRFGFTPATTDRMSPHFRRIYQLASLLHRLRLLSGDLLVMQLRSGDVTG